jgi:hypothetical protein
MLVRDVIEATAEAGDATIKVLLTGQTRALQHLRQVGILVSSRLVRASWPVIGRTWGGRSRAGAQAAALKAEARLALGDERTVAQVAAILARLDVGTLPNARPAGASYRLRPSTLRARIAQHEARARSLRAQLCAIEGDAR